MFIYAVTERGRILAFYLSKKVCPLTQKMSTAFSFWTASQIQKKNFKEKIASTGERFTLRPNLPSTMQFHAFFSCTVHVRFSQLLYWHINITFLFHLAQINLSPQNACLNCYCIAV